MAIFWHHECACGCSFDTSGQHEFFRDAIGGLRLYGHPLAKSPEAKAAGIAGFCGKMHCLACDSAVDVVMREFQHPQSRDADLWTPNAIPLKPVEVRCPACGDESPVMGDLPFGDEIPCPMCGGSIRCEIVGWS